MGFIFVPLTILATVHCETTKSATPRAYTPDEKSWRQRGNSGRYTMLARNAQVHQTMLLSHSRPMTRLFSNDCTNCVWLAGQLDPTTATQTAYGVIYQTVVTQASLLSYVDAFQFLAFLCLLACLAPLFFKKVKAKPGARAMH